MSIEQFDPLVRFGRDGGDPEVADFLFNTNALRVKKLLAHDVGDAPDIGFGRAGPDGVPYDHLPLEPVQPGQNLGTWYWRGWEAVTGFFRRSAQIYCRYRADGGGSLHLATNTGGVPGIDGGMTDRIVLHQDGTLGIPGLAVDAQGRIICRLADGSLRYLRLEAV